MRSVITTHSGGWDLGAVAQKPSVPTVLSPHRPLGCPPVPLSAGKLQSSSASGEMTTPEAPQEERKSHGTVREMSDDESVSTVPCGHTSSVPRHGANVCDGTSTGQVCNASGVRAPGRHAANVPRCGGVFIPVPDVHLPPQPRGQARVAAA